MSNANTAFQELSLRHVNNVKLLRQVRSKQARNKRELAVWRAVEAELAEQRPEQPVYRAVGRAFVLQSPVELASESQTQLAELSDLADKFEKQNVFLMAKVRENEKQLGELMRSQN